MEYIICASQRTGSTLVANTLKSMCIGKPDEFFNIWFSSDLETLPLNEYISKIKDTQTCNGIFGLKVHYCQIEQYNLHELPSYFPNAKYIWLYRRNKLRQAISLWKAMCTQCWHSTEINKKPPQYNYSQICNLVVKMTREIECWENFFASHNIKPLEVVYENLDKNYKDTVYKILDFLGVEEKLIPPPLLEKQSDKITEFWVKKFMNNF